MRKWLLIAVMTSITACMATKAPVQEMAEARSAIAAARQMSPAVPEAEAELKSAEEALSQAAQALDQQRFEEARRLAVKAKLKAQRAARLKQKREESE